MPNFTERLFRITLLYAGLVFLITGLWGIVQAWIVWRSVTSLGPQGYDPICYFIAFTVLYAPRIFFGVLLLFRFRRFARKILSKLSTSPERLQLVWHDTPVFAALLSLITGLYFLYAGLTALPQTWLNPMIAIAQGYGIYGIIFVVIAAFRQQGQIILTPVYFLICGLIFCCYTDKISAKVTRMVKTTPEGEPEDQIMNTDNQTDEAKKVS
ncbi:MAG: hypothetical protein FWC50_07415 [Planctomycetaceae bacterium]|nr:hypothetical protein [Planctomycetaceae bacterium]